MHLSSPFRYVLVPSKGICIAYRCKPSLDSSHTLDQELPLQVSQMWNKDMTRTAHLVEGAILVVGSEGILLQEVILEEAGCLQNNLVILCQGVLHSSHWDHPCVYD